MIKFYEKFISNLFEDGTICHLHMQLGSSQIITNISNIDIQYKLFVRIIKNIRLIANIEFLGQFFKKKYTIY